MIQHKYKVGSIIRYRVGGENRRLRVTERQDPIKNGEPGFEGNELYVDNTPKTPASWCWGYDDQIIEVVAL